jgi:hypothetical protein
MVPNALKHRLDSNGMFLQALHHICDQDFLQVKADVLLYVDLAIEEWEAFIALPQVMDNISAIFKQLAISAMGD